MFDRERLSKWIDEQDKTVTEIAAELGITQSHLSSIRSGNKEFGPGFCWRFRKAYGNEAADSIFIDELQKPVRDEVA